MVTVGDLRKMFDEYNLPNDMPIRVTINGTCFDASSFSWNRAIKEDVFSVKIRVFVTPEQI